MNGRFGANNTTAKSCKRSAALTSWTILGESLFLLLQKSLQNKCFIQKISLQKYFNTQLSEKRRNLKLTQRSLASAAQH